MVQAEQNAFKNMLIEFSHAPIPPASPLVLALILTLHVPSPCQRLNHAANVSSFDGMPVHVASALYLMILAFCRH
jgi:hypothetical protein